MLFSKGVEAALLATHRPVISSLDFYILSQRLHARPIWQGEPLRRLPKVWDITRCNASLTGLLKRGVLALDRDFHQDVYQIIGFEGDVAAEEVACLVDPFCYVSHASAIHLHGWTASRPSPLRLSTPESGLWRDRYLAHSQIIAPDDAGIRPHFARISFADRLRRRPIVVHETSHPAPVTQQGVVRVSTVGATFVDSLAEPGRCGGMAAVLKLWRRHARNNIDEVIAAIDRAEAKIVKVRAGYILEEMLGIDRGEIAAWAAFAQRGGSRKLDPEQPYASRFSERWMLSLNAPT